MQNKIPQFQTNQPRIAPTLEQREYAAMLKAHRALLMACKWRAPTPAERDQLATFDAVEQSHAFEMERKHV